MAGWLPSNYVVSELQLTFDCVTGAGQLLCCGYSFPTSCDGDHSDHDDTMVLLTKQTIKSNRLPSKLVIIICWQQHLLQSQTNTPWQAPWCVGCETLNSLQLRNDKWGWMRWMKMKRHWNHFTSEHQLTKDLQRCIWSDLQSMTGSFGRLSGASVLSIGN